MDKPTMPPPPELPSKPRGFFWVYVAALFLFTAGAGLTFAIMGSIWPLLIGAGVLLMMGLQYLVWGWRFERTLKDAIQNEVKIGQHAFLLGDLLLAITCFAIGFAIFKGIPWPGMRVSEAQQAIAGITGALFGAGLGALRRKTILGMAVGGIAGLVYAVVIAAIPRS